MKITTLIITAFMIQVSAATKAQITLNAKQQSLMTVLKSISKQSGYDFIYSRQDLEKANPVNILLKDVSIDRALRLCFCGQPLIYEISDKTVMVKLKTDDQLLNKAINIRAPIDIQGRVVDEQKKGLPGVTVRVKDGSKATISGSDGAFSLKGIEETTTITFSFIGYATKEVKANAIEWLIQLEPGTSKLDEVQVQAYGVTSQRLNTGDIGSLKAAAIEKQPVTNPLQALQGRIAGVDITQQTGVPGSAFTVQIRGQNSIANGSEPLYVIDGVPYTTDLLQTQGQSLLGGSNIGTAGNTLNYLNLGDIESIDVLKDAAATAIYGSRGANGVVLITTKKGKVGPMSVRLNAAGGISKVTHRLDMLNTTQYLQMRREAFANDNVKMTKTNAYDVLLYDSTRNINWQDKLIGNTGKFDNVHLTISGGNTNTQYNVSALYNRQTTVFPAEYHTDSKGVNFNINTSSADSRFSMLVSGSYLINNSNMTDADLMTYLFLPPNLPDLVNADGSLNYTNISSNYVSTIRHIYNRDVNNLISNAVLSYQVLPGLNIKASLGYTNIRLGETISYPGTSINPAQLSFFKRSSAFTDNKSSSWIAEPQINYIRAFGDHRLNILAGMSFQANKADGQILNASGFTNDTQLNDPQAAPSITVFNQGYLYKYTAGFARFNYSFSDKYLVELSGRRDGSSRFGSERRFSNFGALGMGWIFSQESFIKDKLPWLSFGKLRGSIGVTGNDQIGDYRYMSLYGNYTVPYQGAKGLTLDNLTNPELEWEKTTKLEAALDLGFFKDRFLLTINYYRNRSSNQLLAYPLSDVTGFDAVDKNFEATVQNKGWEFTLTSKNIGGNSFNWTTSGNVYFRRNKLVAFPDLANSSYYNTLIIGQPIYIGHFYNFAGVNPATGVYQFYAANGTLTSSPSFLTDRTVIFDRTPKFAGGLTNDLNYKRWDLSFSFQFVKQTGQFLPRSVRPGGIAANQLTSVLGRWQHPGDVSDIQKFSRTVGNDAYNAYLNYYLGSSATMVDASFIRLKNLSFGYSLPENAIKKVGIKQARLYIQGQNLFTITGYKGMDPENQSLLNLPPLFTLTAGLQVTF